MHEIMVQPLPPGCRLTALFDSCHSGSILDLPYLYHSNGRVKGSDVTSAFKKKRATPADVITWSGSADSQTSADTVQNGLAVGAMSHAFVTCSTRAVIPMPQTTRGEPQSHGRAKMVSARSLNSYSRQVATVTRRTTRGETHCFGQRRKDMVMLLSCYRKMRPRMVSI